MKIGSLKNTFTTYSYVPTRDYTKMGDRFTRNTHIALDFLVRTNILTLPFEDNGVEQRIDIIDVLIADTTNNITIVPGNRNAYNHRLNSVMFIDTHGVVFKKNHRKSWFRRNKGFNSPVALLSHELIHCYNELYDNEEYLSRKSDHSHRGQKLDHDGHDLSFPNAEEAFVIKMTNLVAKRLGEDKRSNYGRSYYPTRGVLSTKKK
jgi:hypothetical protein